MFLKLEYEGGLQPPHLRWMSLTSIDTMSWSAMIRFRAGGRWRVEDPVDALLGQGLGEGLVGAGSCTICVTRLVAFGCRMRLGISSHPSIGLDG